MPTLPDEPPAVPGASRRDADRRQNDTAIGFTDRRAAERRTGKDRRAAPRA